MKCFYLFPYRSSLVIFSHPDSGNRIQTCETFICSFSSAGRLEPIWACSWRVKPAISHQSHGCHWTSFGDSHPNRIKMKCGPDSGQFWFIWITLSWRVARLTHPGTLPGSANVEMSHWKVEVGFTRPNVQHGLEQRRRAEKVVMPGCHCPQRQMSTRRTSLINSRISVELVHFVCSLMYTYGLNVAEHRQRAPSESVYVEHWWAQNPHTAVCCN